MCSPENDLSVVLRGTGGRICMVPAAFPIFPALTWHPGGCTTASMSLASVLRQRQTDLSKVFVDWLILPVYEVSLPSQRVPRRRVDVAGLGRAISVRSSRMRMRQTGVLAG